MKKENLLIIVIAVFMYIPVRAQSVSRSDNEKLDRSYCLSVDRIESYRKLIKMANRAISDERYDKTAYLMECVIKKHPKKVSKDDVLNYYFSLIREGKADEIPNSKLADFNQLPEVERVIDIAKMKTVSDRETDMERVAVELDFVPKYGIRYKDGSIYYLEKRGKDRNYVLRCSEFKEGVLGDGMNVNDTISSAVSVISQYDLGERGKIYNIIPPNDLPARIITRGKGLPNFNYNSRTYSCSMPYFDENSQRLYFCSDMPGGYGGWDIYYSDLKKGKWEKPVLMGDQVNTALDELFPVVTKSCLLFSSDGHKIGKGGLDNYAYSFNEKPSYNLSNFNTVFNDYCLNLLEKENENVYAICVSNDSLVYYQPISILENIVENIKSNQEVQDSMVMYRELKPISELNEELLNVDTNETETEYDLNSFLLVNGSKEGVLYFDFDRSEVKKKYVKLFKTGMDSILKKNSQPTVLAFGGTDPIGHSDYNNMLAYKRAVNSLKSFRRYCNVANNCKYVPVVLGENHLRTSFNNGKKRTAYIEISNYESPYPVILAIAKKDGKSISELSQVYNNSEAELEKLNNIFQKRYPDLYFVGIKGFHRIKKGENLYRISLKNKVDLEQLKRTNSLKSNYIKPNKILVLPVDFK